MTTGGGSSDVFGRRPTPLTPPDPYSDLSKVYPNLSGTNAQLSSDVLSKLKGELSPATVNAIQDAAARFGITSGMPGSGLQWNKSLRDIGLTSEQVQQQGIQDYTNVVPTISRTQTLDPALQTEIGTQNALWASGPDPAAAGTYAQNLFDKYLASMRSPAGGTGGGSPWEQSAREDNRIVPYAGGLFGPGPIGGWY